MCTVKGGERRDDNHVLQYHTYGYTFLISEGRIWSPWILWRQEGTQGWPLVG